MEANYLPLLKDKVGRMHHLVEECGEVVKLVGKSGRFGLSSWHPKDKRKHPARNGDLLLAEIEDLRHALAKVAHDLAEAGYEATVAHDKE